MNLTRRGSDSLWTLRPSTETCWSHDLCLWAEPSQSSPNYLSHKRFGCGGRLCFGSLWLLEMKPRLPGANLGGENDEDCIVLTLQNIPRDILSQFISASIKKMQMYIKKEFKNQATCVCRVAREMSGERWGQKSLDNNNTLNNDCLGCTQRLSRYIERFRLSELLPHAAHTCNTCVHIKWIHLK